MVAAVWVPRATFVPARGKGALVATGIVGPREEVLVMVVVLADVDAVHAPRPVFPSTPDVSRCCLPLAAAVVTVAGEDLGEVTSLAAGNWRLKVPWTVATGSPLHHCPAVVDAVGKEVSPTVVADLAEDIVGPDWSTANLLVGIC